MKKSLRDTLFGFRTKQNQDTASAFDSAYHFSYADDNLGERHSATLVFDNTRSDGESQCSYECKEGRALACDESAREAGDTTW